MSYLALLLLSLQSAHYLAHFVAHFFVFVLDQFFTHHFLVLGSVNRPALQYFRSGRFVLGGSVAQAKILQRTVFLSLLKLISRFFIRAFVNLNNNFQYFFVLLSFLSLQFIHSSVHHAHCGVILQSHFLYQLLLLPGFPLQDVF